MIMNISGVKEGKSTFMPALLVGNGSKTVFYYVCNRVYQFSMALFLIRFDHRLLCLFCY